MSTPATPEEVRRLAALARIEVSDAELPTFIKEFDAILSYVGTLESIDIPTDVSEEVPAVRNVFREDVVTYEAGSDTEKIAEQFSARNGDSLSVKQIITHE